MKTILPIILKRTIYLLLVFLFSISTLEAQEVDLEDLLIAYYPFDNHSNNIIQEKNHAIPSNISYARDRFGEDNKCCYMDGNLAFLTIPHTEDYNWDARTQSYSILFWVNSENPTAYPVYNGRIFSKWSEQNHDAAPFTFQYSNFAFLVAIYHPGAPAVVCRVDSDQIWNGNWSHFALVYDSGSQTAKLYMNGILQVSDSGSFFLSTGSSVDIIIGKTSSDRGVGYYTGYFDDLYIYDRAINECEVEALYSGNIMIER